MSSGFISEAEATEARKKRQEEWERVRKPSDPLERPEQPYDNRSLFERLQEQKMKKDLEYEEAHKLKNMIKGLDDDEIEFLDLVDRTKLAADKKKEIEEEKELRDYRDKVAKMQEKTLEERLQAEIVVNKPKVTSGGKLNQQKLLKGVVVKRPQGNKRKLSSEEQDEQESMPKEVKSEPAAQNPQTVIYPSALKCVAVLPGLGQYADSSSEDSSESDVEEPPQHPHAPRLDLCGRVIGAVEKKS